MGPRGRRARRRGLVVGGMVGASMAKKNASSQAPTSEPQNSPQQPTPAQDSMAAQLEELNKLKEQGILTQEEFDAKKKQILGI